MKKIVKWFMKFRKPKNNFLPLELGKEYVTRSGRKATVVEILNHLDWEYPIVVKINMNQDIVNSPIKLSPVTLTLEGFYKSKNENDKHDYDIIGLWKEVK